MVRKPEVTWSTKVAATILLLVLDVIFISVFYRVSGLGLRACIFWGSSLGTLVSYLITSRYLMKR